MHNLTKEDLIAENNYLKKLIAEAEAEADGQAPLAYWYACNDPTGSVLRTAAQLPFDKSGYEPVYTRPPITYQRELELLAVIEQMREVLGRIASETQTTNLLWWQVAAREAIALTPFLLALKEHDARVIEDAAIVCAKEGEQPNEGMSEYADGFDNGCDQCAITIRRMAAERRKS